MDRSWINYRRTTTEYEAGVEQFIEFARINAPSTDDRFFCPCVNCLNQQKQHSEIIRDHVICDGFIKSYTKWIWHGELVDIERVDTPNVLENEVDLEMDDRLEEMIRDVGEGGFKRAREEDNLSTDADTPLYPECTKFTRLSAVLKLFSVKARNGWTDKSFTELLEILSDMLPEGNTLPTRNYDAKKVLCPMGMEYKKFHACPNDCLLYINEFENDHQCPRCGVSRYKKKDGDSNDEDMTKGPPAKVLWYLPVVPRLKRLFTNPNDAKLMRWHEDERVKDGQLRHPADGLQWKKINDMFPNFSSDPRNIRFGLASDGINPYGNLSSKHSSWPVLLVIYNLPSWLCMKRKYMMLSMMISGPRQPGNDIDVYLSPLVEDLKMLWEEGVDVYDGFTRQLFKLHAMLFCTINDFPVYGNLSGYSTKGHKACPICEEDTCHHQLQHGRKTVYLGHRRFLHANHSYRRLRKAFNGCQENELAPTPLTGSQVYDRVKDIEVVFGKAQKKSTSSNMWKKRSIFFNLPYWRLLDVRHCIDVMHVEKNVCDSIIGTLLNIQGKTKDGVPFGHGGNGY